jgi:hypothetical protein
MDLSYPYVAERTLRTILYLTEEELLDFRPPILDNALLIKVDSGRQEPDLCFRLVPYASIWLTYCKLSPN